MQKALALTLVLSTFVISYAHADPTLKIQQQYVKPVFPPGPMPCIQCGQQFRPNLGSNLTVNPQINAPLTVPRTSSATLRH